MRPSGATEKAVISSSIDCAGLSVCAEAGVAANSAAQRKMGVRRKSDEWRVAPRKMRSLQTSSEKEEKKKNTLFKKESREIPPLCGSARKNRAEEKAGPLRSG